MWFMCLCTYTQWLVVAMQHLDTKRKSSSNIDHWQRLEISLSLSICEFHFIQGVNYYWNAQQIWCHTFNAVRNWKRGVSLDVHNLAERLNWHPLHDCRWFEWIFIGFLAFPLHLWISVLKLVLNSTAG